ncbi:MAG: peroxiredoxin family protein [Dysgonomonas sp.]
MGVRVVSLSSDHLKESFEKDKKHFPWADNDKLCDFQGFSGKNFLNYGIMSTPTFFLIDKDGIVIRRYALVADIDFFGEKTN